MTSKKLAKNKQNHSLTIAFLKNAIGYLEQGRTKQALLHMGKAVCYVNIRAK